MDLRDRPISSWFFEDMIKNSPFASRGPRVAGNGSIGQVPTDEEGRRKDMITINKAVETALERGKSLKILDPDLRVRRLTESDLNTDLASFSLSPTYQTESQLPNRKFLLPMPHLGEIRIEEASKVQELVEQGERNVAKMARQCKIISSLQSKRRIHLKIQNLLTLFKERWLDSVVLDAFLHILQEFWPFKHVLYLNSAEIDPSLNELRNTPSCFPYVLSVLFYKSHWTVIMIDHVKQQIRYLNSQVVDPSLPDRQSKPFKDLFPGYDVRNVTYSQQCNQSDCGVYSAAWMMIYLYYNEREFHEITCEHMYVFRKEMLTQLILYYFLANVQNPRSPLSRFRR